MFQLLRGHEIRRALREREVRRLKAVKAGGREVLGGRRGRARAMRFLSEDELKVVEEVLASHLPRSLQVYGYVFQKNRVTSEPMDVIVDRWPDFSAILCRPRVHTKGDLFKDICVFAKDDGPLRGLLGEDGIINWEQFLCLGADSSHEETVMGVAAERGASGKRVALCHMLFLKDPSHLPTADRSPLRMSSLDESNVDLVNETWKFGNGERSVQMIRNMIRHFPSCCLWDERGCVVAWILTYPSGAMGMLYTVPEHRGKGYAKLLISTMSRRLHSQGYPVYCFVEEENQLSYRIFRNLGFTEDPAYRAAWFEFHHL